MPLYFTYNVKGTCAYTVPALIKFKGTCAYTALIKCKAHAPILRAFKREVRVGTPSQAVRGSHKYYSPFIVYYRIKDSCLKYSLSSFINSFSLCGILREV